MIINGSSSEFLLLERVDIEVNRGVGGGQQVTETRYVGQPVGPLSQDLGYQMTDDRDDIKIKKCKSKYVDRKSCNYTNGITL